MKSPKNPTSRTLAVVAAGGATALATLGLAGPAAAQTSTGSGVPLTPTDAATGHVYAASNSAFGNKITVFNRASDGKLKRAGTFATGGAGSGLPRSAGFEQSQNGVVLSGGQGAEKTTHANELFAVNAGSNTITAFRTDGKKALERIGTPIRSGGTKPTSITVNGDLLYVLNAGILPLGSGGLEPSISGFRIGDDGSLSPIPGSKRTLSGGPVSGAAQVGFDASGKTVTVTERTLGFIDTFTVKADGTLSQKIKNTASGQDPFGFAVSVKNPGRLFVAQGNFPPPLSGAASSYSVDPSTGKLSTISGNVANQQSDTCWVVLSKGEEYAFVTSFFSNDISSYKIGDDGSLTLLDATAGKLGSGLGGLLGGLGSQLDAALPAGIGAGANDEAISADKKFLYARDFLDGSITGWKIGDDGSLTKTGTVNGVGPAAGFGLAAD